MPVKHGNPAVRTESEVVAVVGVHISQPQRQRLRPTCEPEVSEAHVLASGPGQPGRTAQQQVDRVTDSDS